MELVIATMRNRPSEPFALASGVAADFGELLGQAAFKARR